jgi:hypothetical protein
LGVEQRDIRARIDVPNLRFDPGGAVFAEHPARLSVPRVILVPSGQPARRRRGLHCPARWTWLPARDGPYLRSRFREALLGPDANW